MVTYKDKIIPGKKEKVIDSIKCDMCGFVPPSTYIGYEGVVNWGTGYDMQETCIKIKEGTSYPEGGHGKEINIHICPECFQNEIVKFFMQKGVKIILTDWES